MMNTSTITLPPLGRIYLTTSPRAKYLRITIKPDQTITVTIPKRTSLTTAKKFLQSKIPWIKKHINKLQQQNYAQTTLTPINKFEAKTLLTEKLKNLAQKNGIFNKFLKFQLY